MSDIIQVKEISFSYQKVKVLNKISANFPRGKFISILGPNGSGKTTLLRNISGAVRPDSGYIMLDGKRLDKYSKRELAQIIAFVPQNTMIDFNFTVYDMVLMGRTPYLKKFQNETLQDIKIAKQAMKQTKVLDFKDRCVTQLSGGEMQRVVAARALAQQPEIILLDEPTSHLDVYHQLDLLELMSRLKKQGLTIIAVLHDINIAAQFSDLIVFLKNGQIVDMGIPAHTITQENIKRIYNIDCIISVNPITKLPYMIPYKMAINSKVERKKSKFHIICGGGSGSDLMEKLYDMGYSISAGVLNVGDSDWNTAKILGLQLAQETPFSPIGKASFDENLRLIQKSNAVILTNMYFGQGNLKNIEILFNDTLKNIPVYVIYDRIEEKDYTGSNVKDLYQQLKYRENAVFFNNNVELFNYILDKHD